MNDNKEPDVKSITTQTPPADTETGRTEAPDPSQFLALLTDGIAKNPDRYQADLRWYANYAVQHSLITFATIADDLGIDTSTASRVFRGLYKSGNLMIPPPAKMLSRIRRLRASVSDAIARKDAGFILTPTYSLVSDVCIKVWRDHLIGMIFGESQMGKTSDVKHFRDERNTDAKVIYVDMQGCGGITDLYREFAGALGLGTSTSVAALKSSVLSAISRDDLAIVDEAHYLTYDYRKGSAKSLMSELKNIHDRTGCGMVMLMTKIGRAAFETGPDSQLLSQLWKRGTIQLQLPDALTVADVRTVCAAYGLTMPAGSEDQTWDEFETANPSLKYTPVLIEIARKQGMQVLITTLQDSNIYASKHQHAISWDDVLRVQAIYAHQRAPKHA